MFRSKLFIVDNNLSSHTDINQIALYILFVRFSPTTNDSKPMSVLIFLWTLHFLTYDYINIIRYV